MGAASDNTNLGVCFLANQLYYAVYNSTPDQNRNGAPKAIRRIGSIDFSFNVEKAIRFHESDHFPGIRASFQQLKQQFMVNQLRMVIPPIHECWTTLPKLVYDKSDERDAHLAILMKGVDRKNIEPYWFSVSNQDYKFLVVRNKEFLQGYNQIASLFNKSEFLSDFELGQRWEQHSRVRGSYLTVSCYRNVLCVSSFLLGKFRSATYIPFDEMDDLPYLWLQYANNLQWMQGLHETIYVYGWRAYQVIDTLKPFWDDASYVQKMDSLAKIGVSAEEETYGFSLDHAFPALMLALDL